MDEFTYSVVIGGTIESINRLRELVEGWTLHPGAIVISVSLTQMPVEDELPHIVGADGHAVLHHDDGKSSAKGGASSSEEGAE